MRRVFLDRKEPLCHGEIKKPICYETLAAKRGVRRNESGVEPLQGTCEWYEVRKVKARKVVSPCKLLRTYILQLA
jgi:hypothetical protein